MTPYQVPKQATEPSTYAGLASIVMIIGQFFPQYAAYANLLSILLGGAAVALKERGSAS